MPTDLVLGRFLSGRICHVRVLGDQISHRVATTPQASDRTTNLSCNSSDTGAIDAEIEDLIASGSVPGVAFPSIENLAFI